MDSKTLRGRLLRFGIAAGAVASLLAAAETPVAADGKTVEGVWIVQVQQRDCPTQQIRGTFYSLVTFVDGGTMYESPGGVAFAPGQRSNGHGKWTRLGDSTFRMHVIAQILFTTPPNPPVSPGFEAGWQTIDHAGFERLRTNPDRRQRADHSVWVEVLFLVSRRGRKENRSRA